MNELITLGELLELRIGDIVVRTKLQEIISDWEFVVMQPTLKGAPIRAEDRNVAFTFYRQNGCFSFNAKMSAPFRKGEIVLCQVERISDVTRVQRRQYYRLPIMLDTVLYAQEDENNIKRFRGKTIDLSERSMAVSSFSFFEADTTLTVEIKLTNSSIMSMKARVLRCKKPFNKTDPFEIVLLFDDASEKDMVALRKYIFRQQVLMRRKQTQRPL